MTQNCASVTGIRFLLTAMQSCFSDMRDWSLLNKLQLNEDKTEAVLLDFSQSVILPAFLQLFRLVSTLLILLII